MKITPVTHLTSWGCWGQSWGLIWSQDGLKWKAYQLSWPYFWNHEENFTVIKFPKKGLWFGQKSAQRAHCVLWWKNQRKSRYFKKLKLTFPNCVRPLCCGIAPGLSALEQSALKWEFNLNVRFRWYPFWHYYSQSTDVKSFHTTKHIEFFTWSNDQSLVWK